MKSLHVDREKGLWLIDPEEYYSIQWGFMTYDNQVAEHIQQLEVEQGQMVLLQKHLLAAAYQIAALRDAYAIAWWEPSSIFCYSQVSAYCCRCEPCD